ncbi:LysM peptidoglycan-binding domain-containing protein [Aneurinibacillus sp. Ricciae_BoGa-3]|uniref:LysM peptidoglycan-binding domain-containing protein n=1 Tax=Aneurinibacillus sp. Ricciae_BoGa-3 TaxID=3022697 RepID=UPI003FA41186
MPPALIANLNGWSTPERLVVGQTFVIPTGVRRHIVRPGDTLAGIAQQYRLSIDEILQINPMLRPPYMLRVGQEILIPEQKSKYGPIETNAYLEPQNPGRDTPIIESTAPYLTYISMFSYRVNTSGGLEPLNDTAAVNITRSNRVAPMMCITNFAEGNFSSSLASTIFHNRDVENRLFNNIATVAREKGYRAINIDFERIDPSERELYNQFLTRITAFMHNQNILVSTAVAPKNYDIKTGAWHGAHDYAAHGRIVDFVVVMTYEWGWSGGPLLSTGILLSQACPCMTRSVSPVCIRNSAYLFKASVESMLPSFLFPILSPPLIPAYE